MGLEGDGSAVEELPRALQLNCDHLIKCFEVKDLQLLLEGASAVAQRGLQELSALQRFLGWVFQGLHAMCDNDPSAPGSWGCSSHTPAPSHQEAAPSPSSQLIIS